jgi:NitT/TauT family transport system ATP-binding protein
MPSLPALAPADTHVRVRGLTHDFPVRGEWLQALAGVSLDIGRGEFVSLLGPSGCGKSTLLRLIGGLLPLQRGEAAIDGAPPRAAQRARAIGFVFQDPALLPWRTVAGNVALALEVNRQPGAVRRSDIESLLALVGLDGFGRYYPHQLSGGMQQRVALARALAPNPPLLLMDEPFGALDEITRTELRYELLRISARAGKTVLFVTHSIAEAVLLSDRVAVMTPRPGRIRSVVEIDLPRPRQTVDETDAPFVEYVRRLRALLREG